MVKPVFFWVGFILLSWYSMQIVHEAGHILAALFTGGIIQMVELHPLSISRTDVSPNPAPLIEIWSGPVCGVLFPLLGWLVSKKFASRQVASAIRFFCGFCLIANGAYLGSAMNTPIGDSAELLQHGASRWQLILFSILTVPSGIWMWDGVHRELGIGPNSTVIPKWFCITTWGLLIVQISLYFLIASALKQRGIRVSPTIPSFRSESRQSLAESHLECSSRMDLAHKSAR
ncbi:hypothetical protein SH668x_002203 [Planctomicrobium sp. SH668]|uniref:hypothetical protein n=1 Tax=Planctomicrobium sp. SH668 TaxID=3448126 RepID=UPI003F5CAF07